MKSRLEDLHRYDSRADEVDAELFNQVRLALLRLENPLRFPLPGLRHLEMILDEETWICVDESLNDIPVLAWLDFETAGRASLHEPIPCRLFTYHCHADIIIERIRENIFSILDNRLHPDQAGQDD